MGGLQIGRRRFYDADPGDGICRSAPGNACTLRAAIEEANATAASDTVSVPAGTYTLPLGMLAVSGGTLTVAGAGMDSTIIQASADPATVSHRVFEIAAGTITIRRLTVRHGHPVGAVPEITGGGLAVHGGNVRLDQLRLLNNRIDYVVGGQVFTGRGGGLHVDGTNTGQASVAITNSIIEDNRAPFGAGIFCTGRDGPVTLQIVNSTIQENTSPFRGGGVMTAGCDLIIERSTLARNAATAAGGGLDNVALGSGSPQGSVRLTNVTISGNKTDGDDAGPTGTSFVGGGGMFLHATSHLTTLDHVTFSNNRSRTRSGHSMVLRFGSSTSERLRLQNTLIAHQEASSPNCEFPESPNHVQLVTTLGGNVEFPGQSCIVNSPPAGTRDAFNLDPLLLPLASNGGPTQTHALPKRSPVLDLIRTQDCEPIDQRGTTRPQDGDLDGIARCDPGAYELKEPDVGTFSLAPASPSVAIGQRHAAVLTWTAPNVDLTIGLGFRPPTKGRTFAVEVAATEDGASQGFAPAGTIAVER